jgi:LuxR family maltose regulon positive regulatory protein
MRLSLMRGDWFEVLNIQRQTAEIIEIRKLHLLRHTYDLCESSIFLMVGMPEKVSFWITEGDASKARLMYPAKPALNIVYGRYLLAAGEYVKLCGTAEAARQTASKYPYLLGMIYSDIYLSAAYHGLSREDKATACLASALDAAMPDNILMPFVENAGYIMDLLMRLSRDEGYAESVSRIMELYWGFEKTRKKIMREHFTRKNANLTERELEVARLVAQDMTNQQISENLHISLNTVKTHIKNIFMKTQVSSRMDLKGILKDT